MGNELAAFISECTHVTPAALMETDKYDSSVSNQRTVLTHLTVCFILH